MKKLFELLILVLVMSFIILGGTRQIAYAGVGVYNNTGSTITYKGVYDKVKCQNRIDCYKDGPYLRLRSNDYKAVVTFTSGDTTPSVAASDNFQSFAGNAVAVTNFTNGYTGQAITILSQGAVTFTNGATLRCGTTSVVTASGDITTFVNTGTYWQCLSRLKASTNLN